MIVALSIFASSIIAIGLLPLLASAQSFQTAGLDVDFTGNYTLVWTDKGSGAAADASFWRPEPASGWFRVGHHLKRGHGNPTEPTMVLRVRSGNPLARPVDYVLVWNDAGAGSTQDGSVWRPLCPNGFGSMGDVTSNSHSKPALDEVVCVQRNFLGAAVSGNEIWNDAGSGAARDFAAWNIVSPAADVNFNYFSRGLFFGNASRSLPPASSIGGIWAIRMPRPTVGTSSPISSTGGGSSSGGSVDEQFWDAIKNSQRASDFQSYLSNFPNGQFAALARLKIDQLAPVSPVTPPQTQLPTGGGTNVDQQFWEAVKNSQRIADYQSYLQNFPNGQFAALARLKIDQLNQTNPVQQPVGGGSNVDEQFWDSIKTSQQVSDYQSYLRNFPNGQFAALARLKIDQLSQFSPPIQSSPNPTGPSVELQFWDSIQNSQRVSDYQSYLQSFPNGQFAALARLKIDQLQRRFAPPSVPSISQNAAMLNKSAAETRTSLPLTLGQVQLFAAESHCQSGCQVSDNTDSVVISARTPSLSKQSTTIGQIEQFLKPQLLKTYCGTPEQRSGISMGVTAVDMLNQPYGNFFLTSRDCGGTTSTTPTTVARPPATGFQQVISSAQPGSISEIAQARSFFVVSSDFAVKSKIASVLAKELPQLRPAVNEQTADFLIGFELTDRTTGLVTTNDPSNPNLNGELIVFTMVPAIGNSPESVRILFRVKKGRNFGVFSGTPDESGAKDFVKELKKVIR